MAPATGESGTGSDGRAQEARDDQPFAHRRGRRGRRGRREQPALRDLDGDVCAPSLKQASMPAM